MNSFVERALCLSVSLVLFGVTIVAAISYFWERLEARSVTAAWGHVSTSHVVESAIYRSAPLRDRKPNTAPTSVLAMVTVTLCTACLYLLRGVVGVALLDGTRSNPVEVLLHLFMSAAGIALFGMSGRFLRHRSLRTSTMVGVQCFHALVGVKTFLSACGHGGGRELLPAVFYGAAWLLVSAIWLSPFRVRLEHS
jgi:hypothetical protein